MSHRENIKTPILATCLIRQVYWDFRENFIQSANFLSSIDNNLSEDESSEIKLY